MDLLQKADSVGPIKIFPFDEVIEKGKGNTNFAA